MNPKVSVIVPLYNAEKYLRNCVDSILNQQLKDIEIVLVDDGSSDKSGEICDDYAQRDKRVQVLHLENQGVSNARNKGIEASSGDFIAFVDADDWIEKQMYSDMLSGISRVNADIIMCSHVIFNGEFECYVGLPWENNSVFENKEIAEKVIPVFVAPMDIEANSQRIVKGSVWNCLFRKEAIRRNKIEFDTRIKCTEDLIFVLQFLSKSKKVLIIRAPYYHYRKDIKNKTGITQKFIPDLYSDLMRSQQHIRTIITEIGYSEEMRMHEKWRSISCVVFSTRNLCAENSPYSFMERIKKAKLYINDSHFKKSIEMINISNFTPKQKVLVML